MVLTCGEIEEHGASICSTFGEGHVLLHAWQRSGREAGTWERSAGKWAHGGSAVTVANPSPSPEQIQSHWKDITPLMKVESSWS